MVWILSSLLFYQEASGQSWESLQGDSVTVGGREGDFGTGISSAAFCWLPESQCEKDVTPKVSVWCEEEQRKLNGGHMYMSGMLVAPVEISPITNFLK